MTNSTFIEGYSTTGELHYAPYVNDPRISHAHGWATGPTGSLTFLVAGIQLVSAGGETWRIAPSLGDLQHVHAGFSTSVGAFEVEVRKEADGAGFSMSFETPEGTEGGLSVEYPACSGRMVLRDRKGRCGDTVVVVESNGAQEGRIVLEGLAGGEWEVAFQCE
ncbi:hypothetical protein W97_00105 [Coniosporium apollinis CBS 100218]|uniref:Alpha-L-rhamnosidase C-terminal domain-containing protein n=1 Tax=Coniosporium apollinis (strain CBS 100218) TaxID=1168221 RepID=R7YG69_CONA1|nr:uncharacterized protein W97_00105 [Coniosporium apollinis CBS 100218]EON60895.1 hypothetical protein W97_00105 [Coniosporium apollinis CBS 100218]